MHSQPGQGRSRSRRSCADLDSFNLLGDGESCREGYNPNIFPDTENIKDNRLQSVFGDTEKNVNNKELIKSPGERIRNSSSTSQPFLSSQCSAVVQLLLFSD